MNKPDVLLTITPYHLELLRPLVKWKILSIKELFEEVGYPASYKSFHKIIQRLEKERIIGSFKDVWTKSRRLYLTKTGDELVNPYDWPAHLLNEQNLFHDSRVTLYLRHLASNLPLDSIVLEQERMKIRKLVDFQKMRPDAEFSLQGKKGIGYFILEVELTQKERQRAFEKIFHYRQIPDFKSVLFIFPTPRIYEFYVEILKNHPKELSGHNYVFALDQGLIRGSPALETAKAYFLGEETTLRKAMDEIVGGLDMDFKANLGRLWREGLQKAF